MGTVTAWTCKSNFLVNSSRDLIKKDKTTSKYARSLDCRERIPIHFKTFFTVPPLVNSWRIYYKSRPQTIPTVLKFRHEFGY